MDKIDRRRLTRLSNTDYLGVDMVEAGNDLGPGTLYGRFLHDKPCISTKKLTINHYFLIFLPRWNFIESRVMSAEAGCPRKGFRTVGFARVWSTAQTIPRE